MAYTVVLKLFLYTNGKLIEVFDEEVYDLRNVSIMVICLIG